MFRRHFLRALALLTTLLLCACSCALCEEDGYPALSDPVDQHMQRLAIMSQRDPVFFGVPYNKDYLNGRGCQPISMANGIIAAFGVTDYDAGVQIVLESSRLLVPDEKRLRAPVLPELLPPALNPETYAGSDRYPVMAETICAYPGRISATLDILSAEEAAALAEAHPAPAVLSFRMSVYPSWEEAVRLLFALHDMGMDDAMLCLTRMGAGKESYGTPFASGKSGHYISALIHVGKFMQDGSIYILDSLPRAILGESSDNGGIFRGRYPFAEQRETKHFNRHYEAARIQPSVIRLTLKEDVRAALTGETTEEQLALRTDYLKSFTLYGTGSLLLTLPERAD